MLLLPATVGVVGAWLTTSTDESDAYVVVAAFVAVAMHRFASQAGPEPEMLAISWRNFHSRFNLWIDLSTTETASKILV